MTKKELLQSICELNVSDDTEIVFSTWNMMVMKK